MQIVRNLQVPTGNILVVDGEYGFLEVLSIGDYGKEANVKCDALGLTEAPAPVKHQKMLPLEEKWVVTLSSQYGCSMGCKFCDVPKAGPGKNATDSDLWEQVLIALSIHPEVTHTQRLNVHFARMGEPTYNFGVLRVTRRLRKWCGANNFGFHPVVSTMMPQRNVYLKLFLSRWMEHKNNEAEGEAGLQLSINSTSDYERFKMFNGNSLTLGAIGAMVGDFKPKGRKITLNFALAGYEIDPQVLLRWFDPEYFIIKLTPMHKTKACIAGGIATAGDYTTYEPYEEIERKLVAVGYDVLVFIASEEEDLGRITCGNAILSGSLPLCDWTDMPV